MGKKRTAQLEAQLQGAYRTIQRLNQEVANLRDILPEPRPEPDTDEQGRALTRQANRDYLRHLATTDKEAYVRFGELLEERPDAIAVEAYGPGEGVRTGTAKSRFYAEKIRAWARIQWQNRYGLRPGGAAVYPPYLLDGADIRDIPPELLNGLEFSALDEDDPRSLNELLNSVHREARAA